MNNILEYINEYGNNDFTQKPFSNVDGLILAQFSYLKMDDIVPSVGENKAPVELRDIAFSDKLDDMFKDERYAKNNREFFNKLCSSKRFGTIRLNHYINLVSRKWEMQFSAVCCMLPNGPACVVYRGTDENMIGWKEDFNMAFNPVIPAQQKALSYLSYIAERITGDFIIAGHSKGGNLSEYVTIKCPKVTRDRIIKAYSYDGPGFLPGIISDDEYSILNEKLIKLVPRSSIVGMMLQSLEEYSVVESRNFGILQHDPFNWVVKDDDFVYRDDIREIYALQNSSINEWAIGSDPEQMRAFVNQLFDIFVECGVNDLNDFKGNYAEILLRFTTVIDKMESDQKELMKSVVKNLLDTFIETVKEQTGILK